MSLASEGKVQCGGGGATALGPLPVGWADGTALPKDWLLIATPQWQIRGNLLLSIGVPDCRRPLSPPEIELWNLIQLPVTTQEAVQRCGAGADLLIRAFLRDRLCVLVEASFPANRRRVLTIEPHADDAVLSVGGTMWLRRHECAFVIATMASRSNYTRYRDLGGNHDISSTTEIRRRESDLAARMLGGAHVSVGMTDAALRYRDTEWTTEFYRRHRIAIRASISRAADEAELRRWIQAVQRLVIEQAPTEIWFPLGGPHADHMLTADACLAAFAADRSLVRDRIVRIYHEVPYAVSFPGHMHAALAAATQFGAVLEAEVVSIEQVRGDKRRLSSVYDSQDVDELFATGGELPELFWRVRDLQRQIGASGVAAQAAAGKARAARAIAAWVARNRDASLVRVLLTTPSGRWQTDLDLLCTAFPRARFEVWTASIAEAEVVEVPCGRVDIRTVAGGIPAWLREGVRLFLSHRAPTLLLASAQRVLSARLLSSLSLSGDILVISSMDQLDAVLRTAAR